MVSEMSQYVRTCTLTTELLERGINTPDFLDLKKKDYVPLFVYGTLKHGFSNHTFLDGMPYLGRAETVNPCFQMKSYEGTFPIMVKTGKEEARQSDYVMGEVYAVTPQRMLSIDRLENNGFLFERREQMFWLKEQVAPVKIKKNKTYRPCIKAWVYLGVGFSNIEELPDCPLVKIDNRKFLNFGFERKTDMFGEHLDDMSDWSEMTEQQRVNYINQANAHFVKENFNDRLPF